MRYATMFTQEFELSQCAQAIAETRDADVFLFSDWINDKKADEFIHIVRAEKTVHSNAILILTTTGGDPNAAFRMVRFLKNKYRNTLISVNSFLSASKQCANLGYEY